MNRKQRDMLEEAKEFGERFPDVSNVEVLEHVEFVFRHRQIQLDSVLGVALIMAYHGDMTNAERFMR